MLGQKASVITEYITDVLKAKLVPMIHGSPGIGKSSIVQTIAKEWGLQVIDERLGQCDPTDMKGFPSVTDNKKATFLPMDTFPLEGDPLPKGKNGWLLFLDEFNAAPRSVQAAAYKLILDRMVGQKKLHKNVAIVCAGNLETDGAIVNQLSTANQSRLIHMELNVHAADWIEWAQSSGIDHRITSYIAFCPQNLHKFDADHNDRTFACPRTWEFLSDLIKDWDKIPSKKVPLLAGVVSEGMAREFVNFTKVYKTLPNMADIIKDPENIAIPQEPSTRYALSGAIANSTDKETVTPLLTYVNRLPPEFQIITIKEMSKRYPGIQSNTLFIAKVTEIANMM